MRRFGKRALAIATLIVVATSCWILDTTTAALAIDGGHRASKNRPWVVIFKAGSSTCTAEQLNTQWVLTARHCAGDSHAHGHFHVKYGPSFHHYGASSTINRVYPAPRGDILLAHLKAPHRLRSYADLNFRSRPADHGRGAILGYGSGRRGQTPHHLKSAEVRFYGVAIILNLYHTRAQWAKRITGSDDHGDSGGPLLLKGKVVGVCSSGDKAQSYYSVLAQGSDGPWIRRTI